VMQLVGLAACPADGMPAARAAAHYHCHARGGHGAFRDFAEFIIAAKQAQSEIKNLVQKEGESNASSN
jgi:3-deoxy-D-manno-octulosonate 8-phosphate phosphatase KdsC-like HAD superfamily phosphatase